MVAYTYCVDNPVLFIDPNGMYVSWQQGNEDYGKVDPQGRNRYDRFGMFVPSFERTSGSGGVVDSFGSEGGDESNGDGSESTSQEPDPPFNLVEFFLDINDFKKITG